MEVAADQNIWEIVGERRRPRPNTALGSIHFSAQGFRGQTVTMPKPEGTIRVAFLGASTAVDLYVGNDDKTWSAVATERLRAAFPGCRFDFVNAGVPGDTVRAVEGRFVEDTMPLAPDIAVFLLNDLMTLAHRQLGGSTGDYQPSWFARHSYLWLKVEKNLDAQRLLRIAGRRDSALRLDLPSMLAGVDADTGRLLAAATERQVLPVIVEKAAWLRREQTLGEQMAVAGASNLAGAAKRSVYLPYVYIGDVTEAFYVYNERLRETAAAHAVPFIATVDRLPARPNYYVDTVHTTDAGSLVLGTIVGDSLAANPVVARMIAERGQGCRSAR